MALRVIDGVPGSGKTFYAVWHLARNYFRKKFTSEEPVYGFFLNLLYALLPFLKPERDYVYELGRDCTIITNIDGFKPDHIDLRKEIEKAGALAREKILSAGLSERQQEAAIDKLDPVAEFFSFDYQEKYKKGKSQIVYVIDEAQRFFRKGSDRILKERGVFDYFEYHRHWGQDIYLVTQNVKKLPPDIVYLPEYIISSLPRVRSIGIGFKYHWISSGEVIKKEVRRPDQGVFALYKSMDVAENEKIKNPMLKTIGQMFLVAILVCGGGYWYFSKRAHRDEAPASTAVHPPVAGSPAASASPVPGGSYIPVGKPRAREKEKTPYIVFVPLSRITRLAPYTRKVEWLYVWRGSLIPMRDFPHKTLYKNGQLFAILEYDLFAFMFPDNEDRPRDFFVLAAPPEKGKSGSEADDRSAARSDSSGGPARRGA